MSAQLTHLTDRGAALPFATMTYPHFIPDLLSVTPDGQFLAVGAARDGQPCGLAFAELTKGEGFLHSVLVRPEHRNTGTGTALVAAMEDRLRQSGARGVYGTYPEEAPGAPAVARMLAKCGWDPPAPRMSLFTLGPDGAPFRTAPWFAARPLPDGYAIVPWVDLTPADHAAIADQVAAGKHMRFVDPTAYSGELVTRYSSALTSGGRVVGWLIGHRIGENAYRSSMLYVDPKNTPPGIGHYLLGHVLRMWSADADAGMRTTLSWGIDAQNPFLRVFRRKIAAYAPSLVETRTVRSYKRL